MFHLLRCAGLKTLKCQRLYHAKCFTRSKSKTDATMLEEAKLAPWHEGCRIVLGQGDSVSSSPSFKLLIQCLTNLSGTRPLLWVSGKNLPMHSFGLKQIATWRFPEAASAVLVCPDQFLEKAVGVCEIVQLVRDYFSRPSESSLWLAVPFVCMDFPVCPFGPSWLEAMSPGLFLPFLPDGCRVEIFSSVLPVDGRVVVDPVVCASQIGGSRRGGGGGGALVFHVSREM